MLGASLLAVLAPSPVAATHTGSVLQVTPEVSTVDLGATVRLTARLFTPLLVRTPLPATIEPVQVNFRFEGGPLQGVGDASCSIAVLESTCAIEVSATVSGTTLIRAWTGTTPDAAEGRLANTTASSDVSADCIGTEDEDIAYAACATGDTPAAGAAEPDDTDVVKITWKDRGLDVVPDDQTRALGETATLTAKATNLAGTAVPGVPVNFEFFDGSVSDLGGGSTPTRPDRRCTTGADGTCVITFSQVADGVDLVCAWTAANAPAMAGTATGATASCDGELLVDASANDGAPSPADDDQDVTRVVWGRGNTPAPTTPTTSTTPLPGTGYWLVASDGGVFAFGDAVFHGSTGAIRLNKPMVGMAATPTRKGYWLVASDGGIFAFGDAVFRGSTGAINLAQPVVGMASTPNGGGYWLVARDGGVFAFGNAVFRGSMGGVRLASPVVGMTPTPSGNGYWLVAADGGVFAFGDAVFRGSTGAIRLAQPMVGMAATPSGNGYWMVAADGGIFAFGDAVFRGSTGAIRLAQSMVGMSRTTSGAGYWLVAKDGGIFNFGNAVFKGSTGAIRLAQPMVGMFGFG